MTARTALVSAIAFALTRCKAHFRAMAQSHNTDEAREAAAEIIADQILRSGFWGQTPLPSRTSVRTPITIRTGLTSSAERAGLAR